MLSPDGNTIAAKLEDQPPDGGPYLTMMAIHITQGEQYHYLHLTFKLVINKTCTETIQ